MNIVFDTNVLIAAFVTRGMCSAVFEHCVRQHALLTSEFILNELDEKLVLKFKYSTGEAKEVIQLLRSRMKAVEPVDLAKDVCRDPDDVTVLGTAVAGDAACIITGDKDLLVIGQFRGIDIVPPSAFAEYEAQQIEWGAGHVN
ncbi:MAG: putative toxin-antitoxin system toxin component, PIN family [Chloroflexota bacterium]|nr:putative toxin-antitoxin system toxin component, PIN family [Chloroflexota bacterium]